MTAIKHSPEMEDANASSAMRKRIAFLCTHSEKGGVQHIWADLCGAFQSQHYDCRLIALYPSADLVGESSELPFEYVARSRPRNVLACLSFLWILVKFLRESRFDIVFTAMPTANVLVPLASSIARSGGQVVISHHTPIHTYGRSLNLLDTLIGRSGAVSRVITVSRTVVASLSQKPAAYRAKATTIHNALPRHAEFELERLAEQREPRVVGRVVVSTGRLTEQKNYPALIRTSAHLPDVQFLIVGTGADEAKLKKLAAEQSGHDNVAFLGRRGRTETFDLLAKADVFFQPSLFEGHSLALIEAAKLGVPIVVSDVPVQLESTTLDDGTRCAAAAAPTDDLKFASLIKTILDDHDAYRKSAEQSRMLGRTITFKQMFSSYERLAAEC